MKKIYMSSRREWREWLSKNHDRQSQGLWLLFYKKSADKPTIEYDESVEEALCFGWIDSIIKKIDNERYCRKFTPRKPNSKWSSSNIKRAEKLIEEGRMSESGLERVRDAKRSGLWEADTRPNISFDMPLEFSKAMQCRKKAKTFFDSLAPTYQKQYIGWIANAKRQETRMKRINESMELLERGVKLGLK
jgi:uncharacterized protein YdeI (YjbR/CyaY-like superfamily)|tara:strand:+ start:92 stop:661 length:570 start_codon:yes stop_codon:yes gene_type:complete